MLVAGTYNAHAQQIVVFVYRLNDSSQENEELQVVLGSVAGVQQVHAGGRQRPVVMLTAAVYAFKGFFVQQANQTMLGSQLFHQFHGQQVVVNRHVAAVENGSKLVLAGSNFVVLGFCRYTQTSQLFVQIFHESGNFFTQSTKVVLFHFLTLCRGCTKQGAAGQNQVLTCRIVFLFD